MAKYRKYSKEFKLQAAKLGTEQGYSYGMAAKRLGTTGWSVKTRPLLDGRCAGNKVA